MRTINRSLILLSIALLMGSTLTQVLNGCTEKRCTTCAQSTVAGSESNRYCTRCYKSVLVVTTANVDQKCSDDETNIENCIETRFISGHGKVGCTLCDEGWSLNTDDTNKVTSCVKTENNCYYGRMDGTTENCIDCANDMKFTIHTHNGKTAFKCETGGTELTGCAIKSTTLGVTRPSATDTAFTENCWCESGYTLKPDGTCMKHTDNENTKCKQRTDFTDQCNTCDWINGEFAIGTSGDQDVNDKSWGSQLCGSEILAVVGTLFAGVLAFRF